MRPGDHRSPMIDVASEMAAISSLSLIPVETSAREYDDCILQVTSVYEAIGPAVVSLGRGARRGSGVVIAENRVLAMSHSLIAEQVELRIAGERRSGTVEGSDLASGFSLIAVTTGDIAPLEWAQSPPHLGNVVFALGDPGTGLRVTEGRVSTEQLSLRGRSGRLLEGVEHTAPLPRGSVGGPLVNAQAAVVGLNVLRTDPGFLFAIGTAALRPAVERLLAGEPEPAKLGVAIAPARVTRSLRRSVGLPDRDGLLVRDVEEGSPAAQAGIRQGDLIIGVGAAEIDSPDALFAAIESYAAHPTSLKLVRGTDEIEVALNLGGEQA